VEATKKFTDRASFHGATKTELESNDAGRRLFGLANQAALFPHQGEIFLNEQELVLGDWLTLRPTDIQDVDVEFTPEYGRFTAGGSRGGFPSLGFVRDLGKPLNLYLTNGDRISLLVNFRLVSGTNDNKSWLEKIRSFANIG